MGNDNLDDSESGVADKINVVADLVKVVPVYQDLVQPGAKQVGEALEKVGLAVNAALIPLGGLVWGMEKIQAVIMEKVPERMKNISLENIQQPDPAVAGPTLESLRFTAEKKLIRDLYIGLLATSMDKETEEKAHPSFVEIIKQLSSDEAKLLSYIIELPRFPDICSVYVESSWAWGQKVYSEVEKQFVEICKDANITYPKLASSYLDNFRRLHILEFREEISSKVIQERQGNEEIETNHSEYISVTDLGLQFLDACIEKDLSQ